MAFVSATSYTGPQAAPASEKAAMQSAAAGAWAPWWYFAVLAGYVVVCGALSIRLFRWE